MIPITTILLSTLLASVSAAAMSSSPETLNPHTTQVQELLKTINLLVSQEVEDISAGRQLDKNQEDQEEFLIESPRVKGDREVGVAEARGARQTGEMIGSLLGSGLDEVLTTIRPLISEYLSPFMTTIGLTLLEWFSYTDHKTKAAPQETDSKTKTPILFDAFEVEFPEYGKFLVLKERKDGFDGNRDGFDDHRVVNDLESVAKGEKQRLLSRNLERLDSRYNWIDDQDMYRRMKIN